MYCPNRACPDVKRTNNPGEYRREITKCARCGSGLVSELPTWAAEPAVESPSQDASYEFESFVLIYRATNQALVPVVHSLLAAAGIRYFIRNEKILHRTALLEGTQVLVEPARAEEALNILSELET